MIVVLSEAKLFVVYVLSHFAKPLYLGAHALARYTVLRVFVCLFVCLSVHNFSICYKRLQSDRY